MNLKKTKYLQTFDEKKSNYFRIDQLLKLIDIAEI